MLLIAAPSLVVAAGGGVNKTKKQDFLKLQNIYFRKLFTILLSIDPPAGEL